MTTETKTLGTKKVASKLKIEPRYLRIMCQRQQQQLGSSSAPLGTTP